MLKNLTTLVITSYKKKKTKRHNDKIEYIISLIGKSKDNFAVFYDDFSGTDDFWCLDAGNSMFRNGRWMDEISAKSLKNDMFEISAFSTFFAQNTLNKINKHEKNKKNKKA